MNILAYYGALQRAAERGDWDAYLLICKAIRRNCNSVDETRETV